MLLAPPTNRNGGNFRSRVRLYEKRRELMYASFHALLPKSTLTLATVVRYVYQRLILSNGLSEPKGSLNLHVPSQANVLVNISSREIIKEGSELDRMKRG